MLAGTYVAFFLAAFVVIIVPGPTNLMIVSESIHAGVRRSLWTICGAALSHAGFIVVATAGVGAVLATRPQVFTIIKWFGVLYLGFQGIRLILKKSANLETQAAYLGDHRFWGYLLKGFVVNSTNPKALLFYAALFPPFVNPRLAYVPQLLVLAITFLVLFVIIGVTHAVVATRAKELLNGQQSNNATNKISGAVMLGAATWMAMK